MKDARIIECARKLANAYMVSYDDYAVCNGSHCHACGAFWDDHDDGVTHKEDCPWLELQAIFGVDDGPTSQTFEQINEREESL